MSSLTCASTVSALYLARSSASLSAFSFASLRAFLPLNAAWMRSTAYICAMSSSSPSAPTTPWEMSSVGTSSPRSAFFASVFSATRRFLTLPISSAVCTSSGSCSMLIPIARAVTACSTSW